MADFLLVAGGLLVWLAAAIPAYRILRRLIVRGAESFPRAAVFTLLGGALIAPGLLSLGHPPPIPSPGGALLGLLYLSQAMQGQGGSDAVPMTYINLGSWALVTACIGLGESWRLRRNRRFVFSVLGVVAAMLLFLALNGPVGEPARLEGRVIACGPQPHWLTRAANPSCAAELSDGSIHSFAETDLRVYGRPVTVLRYQRRFVGTHVVLVKS